MKTTAKGILTLLVLLVSSAVFAQLSFEDSFAERSYTTNNADFTAPRTDLLRSSVGEFVYGPGSKLEFKIVEDGSGVKTTYFKIGSLPYLRTSHDRLLPERLEDGGYRILYYSVDQSGNQEQLRFDEIFIDKSGPVILTTFNELPQGFSSQGLPIYSADSRIQIQVVDERVAVEKVIYQINDETPLQSEGTSIDLNAKMKSLQTSLVEITIQAYDELGNYSEKAITYQIAD